MNAKYIKFAKDGLVKLMLLTCAISLLTACNEKKSNNDDDVFVTDISTTAVTGFSLKPDNKVAEHLDSLFFSIDMTHKVIFNADSLPMGTNVTKLVPVITYASTARSVKIEMEGGAVRTGVVDYMKNPSDSIDFSGRVTLTIEAMNGVDIRSYDLKVNVHKINPDSLVWNSAVSSALPSRMSGPKQQKTVRFGDELLCFISESDGSYTLATTPAEVALPWSKGAVTFGFVPNLRSLTVADDALFVLSEDGTLYTSADGKNWSSTGQVWSTVIGAYPNRLLGLKEVGGKTLHTSWPLTPETEISGGFPVKGFSNFCCITSKWSQSPIGILAGGRTADGNLTGGVWGYDGQSWVRLNSSDTFKLEGASLVPYFTYRQTNILWLQVQTSVFMLLGGKDVNGGLNRKTYITLNNGVLWRDGGTSLELPENEKAFYDADALLLPVACSGSLEDNFKRNALRTRGIDYNIENYDVNWDAPYVYVFGGMDSGNGLLNAVRRCVLARLTFMPMI